MTSRSSHLDTLDDGKHSQGPKAAEGGEKRHHQLVIRGSCTDYSWLVHDCRRGCRVGWRLSFLLKYQRTCVWTRGTMG